MIYNLVNQDGKVINRIVLSDEATARANLEHNNAERAKHAKAMEAYNREVEKWEAKYRDIYAAAKAKREKEIEALEKKADKLIDDGKPRDAMKIAMRAEQLRVRALRIAYPPEPKRPNDPVFKSPEPFTLPDGYQLERADEA